MIHSVLKFIHDRAMQDSPPTVRLPAGDRRPADGPRGTGELRLVPDRAPTKAI